VLKFFALAASGRLENFLFILACRSEIPSCYLISLAGLPQRQVDVPQMELKNADRPGWAQMTTGPPMDRRPDPQLPQDFWSALISLASRGRPNVIFRAALHSIKPTSVRAQGWGAWEHPIGWHLAGEQKKTGWQPV